MLRPFSFFGDSNVRHQQQRRCRMSTRQQMQREAKKALSEINKCKNVLTQLVAELDKPEPLFWVVSQLQLQIADHNTASTQALAAAGAHFLGAAQIAQAEGDPNAKLKSEAKASNVVKLREG